VLQDLGDGELEEAVDEGDNLVPEAALEGENGRIEMEEEEEGEGMEAGEGGERIWERRPGESDLRAVVRANLKSYCCIKWGVPGRPYSS
jgi:hypothetical protein